MSDDEANVEDFYREIAEGGSVWTVDTGAGMPVGVSPTGQRVIPFWSSEGRVTELLVEGAAFAGMAAREIALAEWTTGWLPGLRGDGMLVGVNWSGDSLGGLDAEPEAILARLAT
jgi:hypothetical protein